MKTALFIPALLIVVSCSSQDEKQEHKKHLTSKNPEVDKNKTEAERLHQTAPAGENTKKASLRKTGPGNPAKEEILPVLADLDAEFAGGNYALERYLEKNLRYPKPALEKGIDGKAEIGFVIGTDGKVKDAEVLKKVVECPQCDKEALRLINEMPKWIPAETNGYPIDSFRTLTVSFRLPYDYNPRGMDVN